MMKSCKKNIFCDYIDMFTKTDVIVLIFYKILVTVCASYFKIIFQHNDMANHFDSWFAKLNLKKIVQQLQKLF